MIHRTSASLDDQTWERFKASGLSIPALVERGLDAAERGSGDERIQAVIDSAEQLNNAVGVLMKLLNEGYEIRRKES